MTEEEQRIRSYLIGQGAKLAPPDLVDKVRQAMGELREAAMTVPTARFGDRPAPEEWSGNEVMAHVLAAGRYFGGGVLSALDGAPAPERMAGQGTEGAPRREAADWWADIQRDREALFARVLAADPGARLGRTVEHRMFGPLNWREALLFMRIHDLDHAGQLKKIAAAFA